MRRFSAAICTSGPWIGSFATSASARDTRIAKPRAEDRDGARDGRDRKFVCRSRPLGGLKRRGPRWARSVARHGRGGRRRDRRRVVSTSVVVGAVAAGAAAAAGMGALGAWWLHRRTRLSARNVYLAWGLSVPAAFAGAGALRDPRMLAGALVIMCGVTVAVVC